MAERFSWTNPEFDQYAVEYTEIFVAGILFL